MKIYFFIISTIFLLLSCSDDITTSSDPESSVLLIEFENDSLTYDLYNYWIPIEYSLTNISGEDVSVRGYIDSWGSYRISQKIQNLRNNQWVIDYELMYDSTLIIPSGSSIVSNFYTRLKGDWRILIPISNHDTLFSPIVKVVNEIENNLEFNIYQDRSANYTVVNFKNYSNDTLKLKQFHYGYCYFSNLRFEKVEGTNYVDLYWDDRYSSWEFERYDQGAICFSDPPAIFIYPGDEYNSVITDIFPQGYIYARFCFFVGDNMDTYETVSKVFFRE